MALTTPILNQVPAFDADNSYTFTFNVIGGSQVIKNRLIIRKNIDNSIVYNQIQTTFQYSHILPAGSLENGVYYNATVQTIDNNDDESLASIPVQFYCYTTPTLTFINMPENNTINNSSFNFEIQYDQKEKELLNSYIVNLYNVQNILVSSSNEVFVNSQKQPPITFSYNFNGFDDNTTYYVECIGVTINDTQITSGKQQFFVNYAYPNIWQRVGLENNACEGYITINSNIVYIEGTSNPSPPTYIDDKAVDLTNSDSWVRFQEGYELNNDFTIRIFGSNFTNDSNIFTMWNNGDSGNKPYKLILNYRKGYIIGDDNEYIYAELYVYSGNMLPYYLYSNYMKLPLENENIMFWIRRINNIYELIIDNYIKE